MARPALSEGLTLSGVDVKFERTSAVAVARGLLVVRYASSGVERDFPVAMVRPGAQSDRIVEIISAPGTTQGCLEKPGDCLVVRVHEAGRLEIGLRRSDPNGSLDASFQIDTLSGGKAAEPIVENARVIAEPIKSSVVPPFYAPHIVADDAVRPAVSLIAHVAMRGDVEVAEDQWIAGPNAPAPIEGLVIRSESPERLTIETQVLIAGAQQWTDWAQSGAYAGTRGRGLPLLAMRLRLSGPEAARAELVGEALFLGSPSVVKKGRQIEFASSSGSDPLVGLKVGVRTAQKPPVAGEADGSWRDRGSRVRVFRSSTAG